MTDAATNASRSILVVDNEALIRHNLADFFADEGFRVFDANNAIGIMAANPSIRVVLTAVNMPGSMDGVKLAQSVHNRYPPTLLVVASGAAKPSASELPAHTMVIAKPFNPRSVLEEVDRLS